MKLLATMMGLLWLTLAGVHAGNISGTVRAHGKETNESDNAGGNYNSRKYRFAEKVDYNAMHDFIVFIDGPMTGKAQPPARPLQVVTTRKITQRGAMFTPNVMPVLVGTTVEWPNHDEIYHNVFSISEPKPFDLGLYKEPEVKRVTFDKPGRVEVFCSIHSAMNCTILVLENPFFAATAQDGTYVISKVPAGTYKLKAWHKRLPPQTVEITVPETGDAKADFSLGITNLPKY
jgi:plastocyanin